MATYNGNTDLNGVRFQDGDIINFDYCGRVIKFFLPSGIYQFECWGAGSTDSGVAAGGKGAYVKGIIDLHYSLSKTFEFNAMVGEKGVTRYNGGYLGPVFGNKGSSNAQTPWVSVAGGATDFALGHYSSDWANLSRLRSRIMVAASGGSPGYYVNGRDGGELVGVTSTGGNDNARFGQRGTQTAGGAPGAYRGGQATIQTLTAGGFGYGGNGAGAYCYGSSSGAGWYGGGGSADTGGATGSSFISGHPGCNAITENGVHTGQPVHYSGLKFTETIMIGFGKSCPNPRGFGVINGNPEAGFARVTCLELYNELILVGIENDILTYRGGLAEGLTLLLVIFCYFFYMSLLCSFVERSAR